MLSGFAHGGVGTTMFRIDFDQWRVCTGSEYRFKIVSSILNQVVPFVLGLLRAVETYFLENTLPTDPTVQRQVELTQSWIEDYLVRLRNENPNVMNLFQHLDRFIQV